MRLICPNCDAHYEVESRLIPENGRDVQCSSCGDTWFQAPPTEDDALNSDLDSDIFASNSDADNTLQGKPDDVEDAAEPETEPEAPEPHPLPERAGLDSAVLNVLREEAERESQARADDGSADLQSQTDMSLEPAETVKADYTAEDANSEPDQNDVVRVRTARLRGIEPEDLSDGSATSRRDLLPDIEEINSTLRATSDRKTGDELEEPQEEKRGGFRTGFSLVLILITMLLLVYSFAPQIGAKVPAAEPALNGFVRTIDQGRMSLDSFMEAVIEKMNGEEDVSK